MFRKHASDLKNSAQRHGCSPEFAEDIVQETFPIAVGKAAALYHSENRLDCLTVTMKRRLGYYFRTQDYAQRLQRKLEELDIGHTENQINLELLYSGFVDDEDLKLLLKSDAEKDQAGK